MKSALLSLIKSKSFISGFIVGVFISTAAAFLLFSLNSPQPNTQQLKGTMMGTNIAIGTSGVILGVLGTIDCPQYVGPEYVVQFTGQEDAVICTGQPGLTENQNVYISDHISNCVLREYVSAAPL